MAWAIGLGHDWLCRSWRPTPHLTSPLEGGRDELGKGEGTGEGAGKGGARGKGCGVVGKRDAELVVCFAQADL